MDHEKNGVYFCSSQTEGKFWKTIWAGQWKKWIRNLVVIKGKKATVEEVYGQENNVKVTARKYDHRPSQIRYWKKKFKEFEKKKGNTSSQKKDTFRSKTLHTWKIYATWIGLLPLEYCVINWSVLQSRMDQYFLFRSKSMDGFSMKVLSIGESPMWHITRSLMKALFTVLSNMLIIKW